MRIKEPQYIVKKFLSSCLPMSNFLENDKIENSFVMNMTLIVNFFMITTNIIQFYMSCSFKAP